MICVAIDAMGGDFGCEPIIEGTIDALKEREFTAFLVGDQAQMEKFVPKEFINRVKFIQSNEIFEMKEGEIGRAHV